MRRSSFYILEISDLDAVRGASEACDQAVHGSTARKQNERSNEEMRQMRDF